MKLPNIVVRILAGAVFVALLLGGILINEYTYIIIFSLITGLALYEFYGLIGKDAKVPVSRLLNAGAGVLLFLGVYSYISISYSLILLLYGMYLLYLFVSELYRKREDPIKSLAYTVLGQVYIALPLSLTNYLVFDCADNFHYTFAYILAVFVIIWVNDSFAYLTGMAFGKRRLFERISPKKSWEGFVGGALFAMGASLLFYYFSLGNLSIIGWIGFAAVVVVFGTWGDLVESLIKRTLGVKDSGNMIPGHGGLLDRFDSTILAIPAAVVYLYLWNFIAF